MSSLVASSLDRRSVKTPFVDRVDCVLDTGAYMLNLASCARCGARQLKEAGRCTVETDLAGIGSYEENVKFQHVCSSCDYVVAVHDYSFTVDGSLQTFEMSCMLCGTGMDERRIRMSSSDDSDESGGDESGAGVRTGPDFSITPAGGAPASCGESKESGRSATTGPPRLSGTSAFRTGQSILSNTEMLLRVTAISRSSEVGEDDDDWD